MKSKKVDKMSMTEIRDLNVTLSAQVVGPSGNVLETTKTIFAEQATQTGAKIV